MLINKASRPGNAPNRVQRLKPVAISHWRQQLHGPQEYPIPPFDVVSLDEIFFGRAAVDLIAALAGRRGAAIHISGSVS
jgi:hypothetical protein